jgi:hypothetical protein
LFASFGMPMAALGLTVTQRVTYQMLQIVSQPALMEIAPGIGAWVRLQRAWLAPMAEETVSVINSANLFGVSLFGGPNSDYDDFGAFGLSFTTTPTNMAGVANATKSLAATWYRQVYPFHNLALPGIRDNSNEVDLPFENPNQQQNLIA